MRELIVPLFVLATTACGPQEPGIASADCSRQVRADGVVYTSHGFTKQPATEHGTAKEAACHDTGPDADGSVFTDGSRTVTTWTFSGYSPDEVLGVRWNARTYAVFVAESVSDAERHRIYAALG